MRAKDMDPKGVALGHALILAFAALAVVGGAFVGFALWLRRTF